MDDENSGVIRSNLCIFLSQNNLNFKNFTFDFSLIVLFKLNIQIFKDFKIKTSIIKLKHN